MKKRRESRAERTRRKRTRREEKRKAKGSRNMAEKTTEAAAKIRAQMEKKAYAEVINTFADMVEQGNPPMECFADVARAYFELGDYTRAASWVTNTLTREPDNVDVRILLAQICRRELRSEDALRLCESILRVYKGTLSYEQRTEIGRVAGDAARMDAVHTRTAYPQLAALLGIAEVSELSMTTAETPAVPTVPPAVSDASEEAPTRAEVSAPQQTELSFAAAQKQAEEILSQDIRPSEKVEVLNSFAGAAYVAGDHAGAKTLLMAALRLDSGDDMTLRNMALLLHDMGEKDKALQVAAKMRRADFLLLRTLKA